MRHRPKFDDIEDLWEKLLQFYILENNERLVFLEEIMGKGEKTREYIIRQAAVLFNQKGFFGSTISDLTHVTGLQKGGIYNHFENKDQLAIEAFHYAANVLRQSFRKAVEGKSTAYDKLAAVISVYEHASDDPPLKGGCPVLNTAIGSDEAHPALKEEAKLAMEEFLEFIRSLLARGIEQGEFAEETNPHELAVYIASVIEGGVMMSRLYNDNQFIRTNIKRLLKEIDSYRRAN